MPILEFRGLSRSCLIRIITLRARSMLLTLRLRNLSVGARVQDYSVVDMRCAQVGVCLILAGNVVVWGVT